MGIATVQQRGQVTIPADVRQACGLQPGDSVLIQAKGNGVFEARALPKGASVAEMIERYKVSGVANLDKLREQMAEEIVRENLRSEYPDHEE